MGGGRWYERSFLTIFFPIRVRCLLINVRHFYSRRYDPWSLYDIHASRQPWCQVAGPLGVAALAPFRLAPNKDFCIRIHIERQKVKRQNDQMPNFGNGIIYFFHLGAKVCRGELGRQRCRTGAAGFILTTRIYRPDPSNPIQVIMFCGLPQTFSADFGPSLVFI